MARLSIICIGLFLFASVWSVTLNVDGASKRLLVLLDNLGIRESHSFYFKQLTGENDEESSASHYFLLNEFTIAENIVSLRGYDQHTH